MKHKVFVSITCSKSMSVEINKDNPTDVDLRLAVLEQNDNLPGMQGDWYINDFVVIDDGYET